MIPASRKENWFDLVDSPIHHRQGLVSKWSPCEHMCVTMQGVRQGFQIDQLRLNDFSIAQPKRCTATRSPCLPIRDFQVWCPKWPRHMDWIGCTDLYGFAWKVQMFPQLFRVKGSMVEASSMTSCCCWSNLVAGRTHDVNLRWHDFFAVLHPDVPQSCVQTTTLRL